MDNNKKNYTFINVVTANKTNGTFYAITVNGIAFRFDRQQTSEGKQVITATMPINGRAKSINKLLGTNFGDEDTIWARLNIWEKNAERFTKMMNAYHNPEKMRLTIVGALSKNTYTKQDGTQAEVVNINVQDWDLLWAPKTNNNDNNNTPANNTNAGQNQTPANPANDNQTDFGDIAGFGDDFGGDFDDDGFVNIDGSEDDIPW